MARSAACSVRKTSIAVDDRDDARFVLIEEQPIVSKPIRLWCSVTTLLLALMLANAGAALASETSPAETKLAVVRSGGAPLHHASGRVIQQLAAGTALTADGRTADSRWVHVSTAEGTRGWVQVERVLLFGLEYLPVLSGFAEPPGTSPPAAAASTSQPTYP
jgi:hypothetical protein